MRKLSILGCAIGLVTATTAQAEQAVDPFIKELHQDYCAACHLQPTTGAPQSFQPDTWKAALTKGVDGLVNSAIAGVRNMPAMGSCQECEYEDFQALIEYMTQAKHEGK